MNSEFFIRSTKIPKVKTKNYMKTGVKYMKTGVKYITAWVKFTQ